MSVVPAKSVKVLLARMLVAGWALLIVSSCDPASKAFNAGPFSGQIVDAQSGRPVPGAFIAFSWGGSGWIEGRTTRLLTVVVQADAEGRYQVPWQGNNLDTAGWHSVSWGEEVWAPGYVLLRTGEEQPSNKNSSATKDVQINLAPAISVVDSLTMRNRMDPNSYENAYNKHTHDNAEVLKNLALALYRDSFHRVCENELPDGALAKRYVEMPNADASRYRFFAAPSPRDGKQVADESDAWSAFDRKAGWAGSSGLAPEPPALDRSLLPELCRLSRFAPAFSGNPA